jgi:dTDP-4-amino-4,6-dideoxygalactose transaminase
MSVIQLSSPCVGTEEIENVTNVLMSQKLNMGNETVLFEQELKSFLKNDDVYVCAVNSCTSALVLALAAHGVGAGDEVLVPSYTFVATFQAVACLGAKPIPCDVDLDDAFLNLDDASSRITPRTKAILPVLFAGCDSKIQNLYEFAKKNELAVIEDAAHSFGTEKIADRSATICFSFDAIKNITCGDGGAIITHYPDIYEIVKDSRLLGVIGDTEARIKGGRSWDFDVTSIGFRAHMNAIAASIGRSQLAKFPKLAAKRKQIADLYLKSFSDLSEFIQCFPIDTSRTVPHIFPIIVKNGKRDDLKKFLMENKIESGVQYKPNHLLKLFDLGYSLPNAEKLYSSMLSIPLHPRLELYDVEFVINNVRSFFLGKCTI